MTFSISTDPKDDILYRKAITILHGTTLHYHIHGRGYYAQHNYLSFESQIRSDQNNTYHPPTYERKKE